MSKGRFGGFRKGKKRYFDNWTELRSETVAVPETVQDNTIVQMDAQTVISFGQTAAEHERAHIFAARELKDMDSIPEDWANTSYWPAYNGPVDPDEPA